MRAAQFTFDQCLTCQSTILSMAVTKVFINLNFNKNLIATLCGVIPFRGVVNYSADRSFGAGFCRQYGGGISDPVLR